MMALNDQKRHEYHIIGHEKQRKGHTLFSYNKVSGEIKKAGIQYCKDVDFVTRRAVSNPKLVVERDCVYRQALNRKNFIKILKREGIMA